MIKSLVVYESMFGNTKRIAEAIALGLGTHGDVAVSEVGTAPLPDQSLDLVVIGGPTHAFGMSRKGTRESAASQTTEALISSGIGIREWLGRLGPTSGQITGAAFDTRIDKPRLPGTAAPKIQRALRKLGYRLPVEPENFYVDGSLGPLLVGEEERATRWAANLVSLMAREAPVRD